MIQQHIVSARSEMGQIEEMFEQAMKLHLSGDLVEAKRLYLRVIEHYPAHAGAQHNLGLLWCQEGRSEEALPFLINAVESAPEQLQFWISLVEVLLKIDAAAAALDVLQQARDSGKFDQAGLAVLEEKIRKFTVPNLPVLSLAERVKRVLAGEACTEKLIRPGGVADIANVLINDQEKMEMVSLYEAQKYELVEIRGRNLVERFPHLFYGWHFLGMAFVKQEKMLEGLGALLEAAERAPEDAQILDHLGLCLRECGYIIMALDCFRRSAELAPDGSHGLFHLAQMEKDHGDAERVKQIALRLLELEPKKGWGERCLADYYDKVGNKELQFNYLKKACSKDPVWVNLTDLALKYYERGELKRAIDLLKKNLKTVRTSSYAFSNLLFYLSHDESLSTNELFNWHRRFAETFEVPVMSEWRPHANDPDPERKLWLGFISGDFRETVVMMFIEPFLAGLDRNQFSLFGFYTYSQSDDVTRRVQGYFDHFFFITLMSNAKLAQEIRAHKIDILIDLSGHTWFHRLETFARRPAPVQMSWIGYPFTTGLSAMDYYIIDRYHAEEGEFDEQFTEALIRMPGLFNFSHPEGAPEVNPLPALRNGFMTFGSFNRLVKVGSYTLDRWCEVLKACPGSKLLIAPIESDKSKEALIRRIKKRGIQADRLIFRNKSPMTTYLGFYNEVDMILDTFPYNGGTTTGHAYWMGVPVLSIKGETLLANSGAFMARHFGLLQFAAEDAADFVRVARHYNEHPEELALIRQQLHSRFEQLNSRTEVDEIAAFERLCRTVWRRWCAGEKPTPFSV